MVVKTKMKKKPKKAIRQKQSQKQIQNVNQIVRVYLDERKKSKRKKTAPRKNLKGVGSSKLNMSSFFPSQNPLMNTYPLQQPYNPFFYPRQPQQQPQAVSTRQNQAQNTTPIRSQNPVIPPNIDVPTNPLALPSQPVNNFPNLQNDNANNILPFMDETNDEVSIADTQLPFMDETNDDIRLAYTHLPFMDETNDDVRLTDYNDKFNIGNIGIMKPNNNTFKTGTADQDELRIPAPDAVPSYGKPAKVSLPFYTRDPVEDHIAMDFNMGLTTSSAEKPPRQIQLLPQLEAEERPQLEAEERRKIDDANATIRLYEELRGDTQGRRPATLEGYKKAIVRLTKQNRADIVLSPLPNRTLTRGSYSTPDQTGRAEDLTPPPVRTPVKIGNIGKMKKKKALPTPE